MQRGQGTVEYLGLLVVVALLLGLLALALSADPPDVRWSQLLRPTRRCAHARRASAAESGARRPDRVGRSIDRARTRRLRRRPLDPGHRRLPRTGLRGLRQGPLRALRARRHVAGADGVASTGPTTRARRRITFPSRRCRASTTTTGKACWSPSRPTGTCSAHVAVPISAGTAQARGGTSGARTGPPTAASSTGRRAATPSGCAVATWTSQATAGTAISRSCPPPPARCGRRIAQAAMHARSIRGPWLPGTRRPGAIPGLRRRGCRARRPGRLPRQREPGAPAWALPGSASRSCASERFRGDQPATSRQDL